MGQSRYACPLPSNISELIRYFIPLAKPARPPHLQPPLPMGSMGRSG